MLVAQLPMTYRVPNTERVGSVKDLGTNRSIFAAHRIYMVSYFLMELCFQGTYINKRVKAHDAEEDNSESDDDEFR
jgi:hypothetical protein